MSHFRCFRATYMSHPRAKYMSQARATIEPLEYAASACHNTPKKGGGKWRAGGWR